MSGLKSNNAARIAPRSVLTPSAFASCPSRLSVFTTSYSVLNVETSWIDRPSIESGGTRKQDVYYQFVLKCVNIDTAEVLWQDEEELRKTERTGIFGRSS